MRDLLKKVIGLLSNRRFFQLVLVLFVIESAWIAFSAVYPMAFDENFHFGLIQVYSHYWLPFLSSQPPHANAFGAVARDPSYLYHYLMSFPYRFINLFTHNQTTQVIILRLINIGLFSSGLVLFKKVLSRVGLSRTLINTSMLIFILIPISPLLAAQINYDNLLFPLIGLTCLLTFNVIDEIRNHKPKAKSLLLLTALCFFTSLVKYAFLPIFLAVVLFILYFYIKNYRGKLKLFFTQLIKDWQKISLKLKIVLAGLVLLSLGMFIQRDGVNIMKYHNVAPDCAAVLSVKQCSSYSAWYYTYQSHQYVINNKAAIKYYNPFTYVGEWLYWMWYRLFFAVNGPASNYANYPPLPLPSAAAALIEIGAVIAIVKWRRRLFNNPFMVFLFFASMLYVVALLGQGYATYRYTDVLENMNGRYLLPILLMLAAIAGTAFSISLKNSPIRRGIITIIALVFFFQGGGVLTFISRSDDSWFWPNSAVDKVNDVAHKITSPVIIDGKKTYTSSLWFFN